ncbi:hypothetical protein C468_08671 [Halorubrum kocurii JCM 14978]|uniref:Uncharacterized protein n=1 Tax=Halorubrum kocurii JCM 14978 TaxID=1230456 RepID=M0P4D2_9EURY|nr:hypothetical protein C468_08671 [Halorubrum kocurii JCM 14978]
MVGLVDALGHVVVLGPHRQLVEVALVVSAGQLGRLRAAPDRREEVVVVHPAELGRGRRRRVEQVARGPAQHRLRDARDVVGVDDRVHQRARQQEALGRLDVPLVQDELALARPVVDERQLPDEPLGVDGAVRHAGVIGVAHEVVHPVHVELARDESAVPPLAGDEPGDPLGVEVVVAERLSDRAGREQLVDVVVVLPRAAVRERLQVVAEGTVADVVEHGRRLDPVRALAPDPEVVERPAGEVIDAQRVLEASVVRGRVDELDRAELFDVSEPLHGGGVDQIRGDTVDLDVVVDGVLDRDHASAFVGTG